MLPDCWLGGRGSGSELPWATCSLNAAWLSWTRVGWSTADRAWLSEKDFLCSCTPVAPTRFHSCGTYILWDLRFVAFSTIPRPLLLCGLSRHLCAPAATDSARWRSVCRGTAVNPPQPLLIPRLHADFQPEGKDKPASAFNVTFKFFDCGGRLLHLRCFPSVLLKRVASASIMLLSQLLTRPWVISNCPQMS